MIAFRYRLRNVPMKVAEKAFTADGVEFPAGSFIITGSAADLQAARAAVESARPHRGRARRQLPTVATHDADVPRVAIYSQWSGTQELGWYRHAFDQFGIPFDLIYKERVKKGNLKADYDVILMAAQNINRTSVMAPPAARPQPYMKSDKYKFLGMYGETPDMSGGFGQEGVDAFEKFLEAGGTLITDATARCGSRSSSALRASVDTEARARASTRRSRSCRRRSCKTDHPVFYGYADKIIPDEVRPGPAGLPRRRRRSGQRARRGSSAATRRC